MKRRGFTLLELIVAMGMTVIIIGAIGTAYRLTLDYAESTPARLSAFQSEIQIRRTLEGLFTGAFLTTDADDRMSYFIAANSGGQVGDPDSITWVTTSRNPEGGFLISDSDDFEELHSQYGPQGGNSEVSLSINPVGDAGDKQGLFLRIQTPADGDSTQGGTETLLIPDITRATYEFWDGTQWINTWDTINGGSRRLPAAVRLTLEREEGDPEIMVFRLPLSDVTAENPITQESGGGGT